MACASFVLACGSTPQGGLDAGPDATTSNKDAGPDASPFGDAGASDAFVDDAASVVLDAGGPFLCADCVCNGVDHFCELVSGGAAPMPIAPDGGFGDAGACSPDASTTGCTSIPSQCLPNPSCACVLANIPLGPACECALDPGGSGIIVQCMLP